MTSTKTIFLILWAYCAEVVLAGLAYGLIILIWDLNQLTDFL